MVFMTCVVTPRAAVCGGDNDIEHFQAADQAVYERVIERWQDQWERNAPEALPCVCTVDGCGFLIFRRNGLKPARMMTMLKPDHFQISTPQTDKSASLYLSASFSP